jgi:hypothetical protein
MNSLSNVELARTLIHESIHAEIYVRMQGLNGGVSTDADFARLFEQYKTYGDERDHNIMAESDHVNLIAQGLKAYHDAGYMAEFDANVGKTYDGTFDYQQFYSMMAWSGLQGAKAFQSQTEVWKQEQSNYVKAAQINEITVCK